MLPSGNPMSVPRIASGEASQLAGTSGSAGEICRALKIKMLNGKTLHQLPPMEAGTISSTTTANGVRSAVKHGAVALLPVRRAPWPSEGEESCRRWRAVLRSMCLTQLRAPSQGCFGRRKANITS